MFRPDASDGWKTDGMLAVLSLTAPTAAEIRSTLKPERGTYRWSSLPGVVVRVVPSEIKDRDGKVIQVIG